MTNKQNPVWECRIREYREKAKLSLSEMAGHVGLSKTGLWQIEQGSDPMLSTARKIAEFFGVKVEVLWPKRSLQRHG